MSSIFRSPFVGMVLTLIILPLLAACAPDASAAIISPNLGQVEIAATAAASDFGPAEDVVVEAPVLLADLSQEEIAAGLPDDIAAALASADPAAGESLALVNACSGCHSMDEESALAGPVWYDLGNRAVQRAIDAGDPGPAAYLYESISVPGDYLVDGYADGVMPSTYLDSLSADEFGTLIAYILAQQEQ